MKIPKETLWFSKKKTWSQNFSKECTFVHSLDMFLHFLIFREFAWQTPGDAETLSGSDRLRQIFWIISQFFGLLRVLDNFQHFLIFRKFWKIFTTPSLPDSESSGLWNTESLLDSASASPGHFREARSDTGFLGRCMGRLLNLYTSVARPLLTWNRDSEFSSVINFAGCGSPHRALRWLSGANARKCYDGLRAGLLTLTSRVVLFQCTSAPREEAWRSATRPRPSPWAAPWPWWCCLPWPDTACTVTWRSRRCSTTRWSKARKWSIWTQSDGIFEARSDQPTRATYTKRALANLWSSHVLLVNSGFSFYLETSTRLQKRLMDGASHRLLLLRDDGFFLGFTKEQRTDEETRGLTIEGTLTFKV